MQQLIKSSTVQTLPEIPVNSSDILTFSISGSGTVQAEVKLTEDDDAVWKVAQVCEDGKIYTTKTGIRKFRFNQTAASGETICEVTGADL